MILPHLALPREGHLAQTLNVFAYLKKYHNTEMVFDPNDPVIDEADFERKDWTSSEFGHVSSKEEKPANMPQPRGFGFTIQAKVDANHAADTVTGRSRTGFLVFLNSAPVYWLSKKQGSVEISTFGSEFCAMKHCWEYLCGLRYKLRMLGISCEEPAYISGDNQSVLYNTTIPDLTLKKKSQSIAYRFVREGSARDEWRTSYVSTHDNEADLLTKMMPVGGNPCCQDVGGVDFAGLTAQPLECCGVGYVGRATFSEPPVLKSYQNSLRDFLVLKLRNDYSDNDHFYCRRRCCSRDS
jgi:hypothetical protein